MNFTTWIDSRIKNLNWTDFGFIKLSILAFALMVAKLWQPILALDWYWYAVIFVLTCIKPLCKVFRKNQ